VFTDLSEPESAAEAEWLRRRLLKLIPEGLERASVNERFLVKVKAAEIYERRTRVGGAVVARRTKTTPTQWITLLDAARKEAAIDEERW
jgi:hypothetical protein